MIGLIHEAIRSMLYGEGKLPANDVDVTFAAPTRDWMAAINRPTVNFYLHSITENNQYREADFMHQRQGMMVARRMRPRRMDLRYLITTHFKSPTPEVSDEEWQVLWRVLATLMRNAEWPQEALPFAIRELDTGLNAQVAQADGSPRTSDLFSSLGIPPRAALHYVITAPLDLNIEQQTPLAVGVGLSFRDQAGGEALLEVKRYAWRLLDEHGEALPGVEVRVPDQPDFSVTGLDGTFTTRTPHDLVRQFLLRRPGNPDWDVLKVPEGEFELRVPGEDG